jgi:hypothetical protein
MFIDAADHTPKLRDSTGSVTVLGTAAGSGGASLPPQTGNSGKFLSTNGTSANWKALGAAALADIGAASGTVAAGDDSRIINAVPNNRNINGYALSADINLTKSDLGLDNVTNDAQLKASALDPDPGMAGNSDEKVPSQKAVVSYVAAHMMGSGLAPGVGRTTLTAGWGAIADGACQEQTAAWAGITIADTVTLGPSPGLPGGVLAIARISAPDTVAIRLCNLSGASVTPGSQSFKGTLAVYNLSGSGVVDFGTMPDGACNTGTFPIPGISAGDPLTPKWPSTLENGLVGSMSATAADIVQVRLCNWSGAAIDPAAASFGAAVAK